MLLREQLVSTGGGLVCQGLLLAVNMSCLSLTVVLTDEISLVSAGETVGLESGHSRGTGERPGACSDLVWQGPGVSFSIQKQSSEKQRG